MSSMDTDDSPAVSSAAATSALSLALHPLPILNISEHLTRLKLQKNTSSPFVIGGLLGTQNGREVEIVNTFELAMDDEDANKVDHGFLTSRKEQYKQVFPSLELIGWYTVAQVPTSRHITIHEQFVPYTTNPILLTLQPHGSSVKADISGHALPFKAYESTVEIKERSSRTLFVEASFTVETGEAERIAVDWSAKGGEGGTSLESHLQTQRAAVKMLHDRIVVLVQYVTEVLAGTAKKDHTVLRSLSALIASLPANEHPGFREEFDKEHADVQLTALLSSLSKATNSLNDLVDKHIVLTSSNGREGGSGMMRRRGMGPRGPIPLGMGGVESWERFR